MAFREVSVNEIREVLRVWLGVAGLPAPGYRTIAAHCGVDRKTIRYADVGITDRLAVDIECLMDLHLGPAGVPVPEHLHEVGHVPRSPCHLRPLPGPRGGAPERSEPEQHPNPRRTRPRGWGIT